MGAGVRGSIGAGTGAGGGGSGDWSRGEGRRWGGGGSELQKSKRDPKFQREYRTDGFCPPLGPSPFGTPKLWHRRKEFVLKLF